MRFSSVAFLGLPALIAALALPREAQGDEARDPVAAEALFAEGHKLMEAQDYAKACPKLEESYRLDPATGAQFALALCHEKEGRLASAWVEFMEVASRANAEGYAEREKSAREHADALRGRLSYLTLAVAPETASLPNLVVTRDGVVLGAAAWGTSIPIDAGEHVVTATAPGHEPWSTRFTVTVEPERSRVSVPKLTPRPAPSPAPLPVKATNTPPATIFGLEPSALRYVGVSLGGAGIACLGLATYSLIRASVKQTASNSDCDGAENNDCGPAGERDRLAAIESAELATVSSIAGVALLGAGVGLLLFGAPSEGVPEVSVGPGNVRVRLEF
jgi:hypothetical protein